MYIMNTCKCTSVYFCLLELSFYFRASAVSTGKSIRDLVKRRRNEDNTDKENLLEEDLHDV